MKRFLLCICLGSALCFGAVTPTADPCAQVLGWRQVLCTFAKTHLQHTAWGFEHSKRDYLVASELAKQDNVPVNDDILFAAAMLHDMGGFAPYAVDGVDHALRSTQVVDTVLGPSGFPMAYSDRVKDAIITHSYYCPDPPKTPEALVLHDADTLDFMGDIGVTRMLSIVGRESVTPTLAATYQLLKGFENTLEGKIYGGALAKQMARDRRNEMSVFLKTLNSESFDQGSL